MAPKKNMLTLKEKMEVVNVLERDKLSVRDLAKRLVILFNYVHVALTRF